MKYKKVLLILSIATLSLSGCKKSEPIDQPVTTEIVETTTAETTATETTAPETTVVETTVAETTAEETTVAESMPEQTTKNRLALTGNVKYTSWGTNQYTGNKQALECEYSDEWAGAVMDVINTLQDGYIETLSEEKLDELIGEIALNSVNVYGEDADDGEVTLTIKEVFKVFRHLNAKEQQKDNIDKIDQATGNQSSGGQQTQQNNPPADQGPVDQGPAPDGAGSGIPFGSSAPSNDKKGGFNEVPGLTVG